MPGISYIRHSQFNHTFWMIVTWLHNTLHCATLRGSLAYTVALLLVHPRLNQYRRRRQGHQDQHELP